MLMLLSSSFLAHANEEVLTSDVEFIDILEFLGETDGLESLGVNLDRLLGLSDFSDDTLAQGGVNNEN